MMMYSNLEFLRCPSVIQRLLKQQQRQVSEHSVQVELSFYVCKFWIHQPKHHLTIAGVDSLFSGYRLEGTTEWTAWSSCSEPCGGGKSLWTRAVPNGCGSSCSLETLTESRNCNTEACSCPLLPPPTEWSPWTSCSARESCGGEGVEVRSRRVVISKGSSCYIENRTLVRSCNTEPCPCPHIPSLWSDWTECSASCGGGMQRRSRDAILGAGSSCIKQPAVQTIKDMQHGVLP